MAKNKVSVAISLQGDREYDQAIKKINNSQKMLRSEMKQVESQFKSNANSIEALRSKFEVLSKQYAAQSDKVKKYEEAVENSVKRETEAAKELEKLQEKYQKANEKLEKLKETTPEATEAIEKQENKVKELNSELTVATNNYDKAQAATEKYKTGLNYANIELDEFDKELKKTGTYLSEAEKATDGNAKSIDQFGNEVEEAEDKTNRFGESVLANFAAQALHTALEKLVEGTKRAAEACVETGSEFEASMSKVEAVSGAVGEDLDALTNKAKQMGATTIFSASQAAEAMNYMAMAGWKSEDMISGIEGVMNLAAASGEDLATTSDIVTDALTAFGLSAQDAGHFADVLAAASSNANTNVAMMGETFSYCAPVAGALGFSIEDTAEAIGLMANAGIKSSQAGTALRRIMQELSDDVKIHSKNLGDVTIKTTETDGSMRKLSDILADCRDAFSQLSESEKASAAGAIVGRNAMSGFLALMNAAPSDIEKLSGALATCDGVAKDMADTMQDNLKGKVTILKSALEGLAISTYDTFDGSLKEGVEGATDAIGRLNDAIVNGDVGVSLERLSDDLSDLIGEFVDGVEDHLPQIIDGLATVIDNADEIAAVLETLVTAWGFYKVAVEGAEAATALMNTTLAINPYLAAAAAVAALGVAFENLAKRQAKGHEQNLKFINEMSPLVSESKKLNETIKENKETFAQSQDQINNTGVACKGLADELVKLNKQWQDPSAQGFGDAVEKQKSIIAELKAAYPELNLAIDEQTGALNMSTEAVLANIDAMQRQAQSAAAQERMTEIAKEKLELQTEQVKLNQQITEQEAVLTQAQNDYKDAQAAVNAELKEYGNATEENNEIEAEALENKKAAAHEFSNLKGQYYECQSSLDELNEEERILNNLLTENAAASENAGTAASGAATGVTQLKLTEEELEEFIENVNKSIDSQINLLEEHQAVTEVSKETLKKNLDEQTGALEQWANDFKELATKGIDDGLLKQLAEMGPAAEGYIQGLLKMSEEELSAYSEKFAEATKLKTETATEIANSYLDAGTEWGEAAGEGTVTGMENKQGDVADAAEKTIEEAKDTAEEKAEEFKDTGEKAMDSTKDGIESNAGNVTKAVEKVGQSVFKTAESSMGKSKFVPIGENIPRGMAEGVKKGQDELVTAVKAMAKEAVAAAEKELVIKSPSKKFEQIGAYTSEGFLVGFNSNTQAIMESVRSAMNETAMAAASPVTTPSGLDTTGVTNAISRAIESGMSQITFNLNVGVGRDSIVEAVVGDNNIFKKQTGASRYV